LIHKELRGRPLVVDSWDSVRGARPDFSILIENTNFTLIQPPPPNQPAPIMMLLIEETSSRTISVNFTVSKCNFYNYNFTALEVDMQDVSVFEDIYLIIFSIPSSMCQICYFPRTSID
jgi:hypothetical protein